MKTEISTLDHIRSRPRFKIYTEISPVEYSENLKKYLAEHSDSFYGNINKEVATIYVKTLENPYWKPNLSIRTELEDEKTVIRGIFGPSSAVWTFFMFIYFLLIIVWMVFITLWFVGTQIKSNDFIWALPVSFFIILLMGLTYLAARIGRKKGSKEMKKLKDFAIDALLPFESKNLKKTKQSSFQHFYFFLYSIIFRFLLLRNFFVLLKFLKDEE